MMKPLALFSLATLLLSSHLGAQAPANDTTNPTQGGAQENESEGPRRFWQATVPGGHYMVAIERISSISRQTYLLDGALVVHEVTVDTLGQALARFYFIEPPSSPSIAANRVLDRGKQVLDEVGKRSNVDPNSMVTKKYPETTHAKTLEFRLQSAAELDTLYKSLKDTWETGRGRKFTIK